MVANLDKVRGLQDLSDYHEAGQYGFAALGGSRFKRQSDAQRGAHALAVLKPERHVGSRFLAAHLLLAERTQTIAHHVALGATRAACGAVPGDGIQTHEITVGAGEHDLRHIEHR